MFLSRVFIRYTLLSFYILLLTISISRAQLPVKQWDRTLGGSGTDILDFMQQTTDGGYVLGGTSTSGISGDKSETTRGNMDFWVCKLDAQGTKQWDHTYGGANTDGLFCIRQTADGGYLLGGLSNSPISGEKTQPLKGLYDYWLVKIDAQGTKQWDRSFGAPFATVQLVDLQQTPDGGYLVGGTYLDAAAIIPPAGDRSEATRGRDDFWVLKLDAQGTKQWDRILGGPDSEQLQGFVQTADGGYVLGGSSRSGIAGDKTEASRGLNDYWLVKLNAQGVKQWDHAYGGSDGDDLRGVCLTADGGYLLGGLSISGISGEKTELNKGGRDFWVVKTNSLGIKQWDHTLGGTADEIGGYVAATANGGYLVGGSSNSGVSGDKSQPSAGGYDFWVVKLQPNGSKQWDRAYGGTGDEDIRRVQQTLDGGYALGGPTTSNLSCDKTQPSRGSYDFWQIKLSPDTGTVSPPATIITGDSLVCAGGQTVLTAFPPALATTYQWSTGASTPMLVVSQPGLYSVTVTLCNGVVSTGQFRVRTVVPTVTIQGDTLLCAGSSVRLLASAVPGATYQWNTGSTTPNLLVTQPGLYTVTARYSSNCTATATVRVRAAVLRITGGTLVCPTSGTVLTAEALGAVAYVWNTGANTAALPVTQSGAYTVQATFASGCTLTASQVVAVPSLTLTGDSLLCTGATLTLTATSPAATAYRWNTGATTATIAVTQPGTYTVLASYPNACSRSASLTVRAQPALPLWNLGQDTTACETAAVVLRVPAGLSPGIRYQWANGSTASTLRVTTSGVYTLQLTGPCAQRTLTRSVLFVPCVTIPTIITPNHDGYNDTWVLAGLATGSCAVEVYNRWGKQVYTHARYANDWGAEAAPGLYYYLVQHAASGRSYKGWVEVVR